MKRAKTHNSLDNNVSNILTNGEVCSYNLNLEKINLSENPKSLLINSDNLIALKALQEAFAGKIKCVYIDPPYNTGKTFEYGSDCFEKSTWLSFMNKRIRLIHSLISHDGFLFLQIDSHELHYIKILLDKIFGRNNYRNSIIISKDKKPNQQVGLRLSTSYHTILVYSKNPETKLPPISHDENWLDLYANGHLTEFIHELNEKVIERVLDWVTQPNDIVLDAFAGSGTTCAVAQRMGRFWIGIEQGEHCKTICFQRLKENIQKYPHRHNGFDFFISH